MRVVAVISEFHSRFMNPVRNPYSPGAGTPPPVLVGRDVEIRDFDIAIQRLDAGRPAKSLLLTGLRGVGKTVLLRRFGRLGDRRGWVCQHVEVREDQHFSEIMAALAREALLRLSTGELVADRVRRALRVLKSFQVRWQLPGGGDVALGVDPLPGRADSGLLDHDLAGLFLEIGEVARDRNRGILFTIDELQFLGRDHLAALMVGLHRIAQEQLPFLVACAGLPSLPGLAGDAKTYAERLFAFRVINSLGKAEARAALAEPAAAENVRWQPEALDRVVGRTRGYPYFLQEFGKHAWDAARGPDAITLSDVETGTPLATSELDAGFFRVRVDRANSAERACLTAMASLGAGPYDCGDVAAVLKRTVAEVAPLDDALVRRGLCYAPGDGFIDFSVPMFDEFVRRALT